MLTCHLSKEICRADLHLSYAACARCLGSTLFNEICRRVANNDVKLIFNNVKERNRIMILRLGDVVLLVNGNENSHVIVMACLFSHALEVVLEHSNELGIILVAGNEDLSAILASLANLLNDCRRENACSCTGIKHCVSGLGLVEGKHISHKARSFLFSKESSKANVLTFRLCTYKLCGISDRHI